MKNLNKILAGIFATISMTEMTHPIILTGPVRRNAHRQEQEEKELMAYEMGKKHTEQDGNKSQNNNESGSSQDENQAVVQSLDDITDENYADDAVVQIQALGDGSLLAKLTPEQKIALKKRLQARADDKAPADDKDGDQKVTTQSMPEEDNQALVESMQPSLDQQAPKQPKDVVLDEQASHPLEQAVDTSAEFVKTVEEQEHSAPEPTLMQQPAAPQEITMQPAAHEQMQPAAQPAPIERVKIIKVYPVYDAVKSGVEMVKIAANDLLQYTYGMIANIYTHATHLKDASSNQVAPKCNCK